MNWIRSSRPSSHPSHSMSSGTSVMYLRRLADSSLETMPATVLRGFLYVFPRSSLMRSTANHDMTISYLTPKRSTSKSYRPKWFSPAKRRVTSTPRPSSPRVRARTTVP